MNNRSFSPHKIKCVLVIANHSILPPSPLQVKCARYWPDERVALSSTYDELEVIMKRRLTNKDYTTTTYHLRHREVRRLFLLGMQRIKEAADREDTLASSHFFFLPLPSPLPPFPSPSPSPSSSPLSPFPYPPIHRVEDGIPGGYPLLVHVVAGPRGPLLFPVSTGLPPPCQEVHQGHARACRCTLQVC